MTNLPDLRVSWAVGVRNRPSYACSIFIFACIGLGSCAPTELNLESSAFLPFRMVRLHVHHMKGLAGRWTDSILPAPGTHCTTGGSELIPAYTNTDRTQIDMEMDMETWRRGPPLWTVLRLTGFNFHEAFFFLLAIRSGFCAWSQLAKIESITFFFFASLLVAQDWPVLLFFFHLFPFEYVPISSILV